MPKDYDLSVTPANAQRRREHELGDEATRDLIAQLEIGHVATLWGEQPFINPS